MNPFQPPALQPPRARFCGYCGQPAILGGAFCGECGAPLTATATSTTGAYAADPADSAGSRVAGPEVHLPSPGPALGGLISDLQALPVRTLVPLRAWWTDGVWRKGWTGMFLFAALAPFFLIHLADSGHSSKSVSWGFSLYFAFVWFLALHTLIRPRDVTWGVLARVAVFTVIAGVAIAIGLEKHLAAGEMSLTKYIFGVGVPEELAKALAVYLFVFRSPQRHDLRSYLFIGAVSGLAFGTAEAVSYSQMYAQVGLFTDASSTITTAVWRLVTDSVFHACMAGITGFFIGLARHYRRKATALMLFGLALAALLHGLYDNFADGWTGLVFATAIVFAFVGYVHTGEQIGAELTGTEPEPAR